MMTAGYLLGGHTETVLRLPWTRATYYQRHSDKYALFNYPIKIADRTTVPVLHPYMPLLYGKICRGWFKTGGKFQGKHHKCQSLSLLDSKGDWAGILRLNLPREDPDATDIPLDALSVDETDPKVSNELVMISAGTADNSHNEEWFLEEWNLEQRPKSSKMYEFYNVVWVEWDKDIAYRKALGRVLKGTWDREANEWIE